MNEYEKKQDYQEQPVLLKIAKHNQYVLWISQHQ